MHRIKISKSNIKLKTINNCTCTAENGTTVLLYNNGAITCSSYCGRVFGTLIRTPHAAFSSTTDRVGDHLLRPTLCIGGDVLKINGLVGEFG